METRATRTSRQQKAKNQPRSVGSRNQSQAKPHHHKKRNITLRKKASCLTSKETRHINLSEDNSSSLNTGNKPKKHTKRYIVHGDINIKIKHVYLNQTISSNTRKRKAATEKTHQTSKKPRIHESNEEKTRNKSDTRLEIVNGQVFVDGKKSTFRKAGVTVSQDRFFHKGIEIVDHGKFTPKHSAIERAKQNAVAFLPDPIEKSDKHNRPALNTVGNIINIKNTFLYKPSVNRLLDLLGVTLSQEMLSGIHQIIQSEMAEFTKSGTPCLVVKTKDLVSTPPVLEQCSTIYSSEQLLVNEQFNFGYTFYYNGDYKNALMCFLKVFLLCKVLTDLDHNNQLIHKQNLMHSAHYLEYLCYLAIEKSRHLLANQSNEKVDSVTTLYAEEFESLDFKDPCEDTNRTPTRRPTESEFNYLKQQFPERNFKSPEDCKAYQDALLRLKQLEEEQRKQITSRAQSGRKQKPSIIQTRSQKDSSGELIQLKEIIKNHQLRDSKHCAYKNPFDLYTSINARIMVEILTQAQVSQIIFNICNLISASKSTNKPDAVEVSQNDSDLSTKSHEYPFTGFLPSISENPNSFYLQPQIEEDDPLLMVNSKRRNV